MIVSSQRVRKSDESEHKHETNSALVPSAQIHPPSQLHLSYPFLTPLFHVLTQLRLSYLFSAPLFHPLTKIRPSYPFLWCCSSPIVFRSINAQNKRNLGQMGPLLFRSLPQRCLSHLLSPPDRFVLNTLYILYPSP